MNVICMCMALGVPFRGSILDEQNNNTINHVLCVQHTNNDEKNNVYSTACV